MDVASYVTRSSGLSHSAPGSTGPYAVVNISNKHSQAAAVWLQKFQEYGVHNSVETLLHAYFSETAREGASDATGPVLNKDHFREKVIVPLLVSYTGLLMTMEQRGTLRALTVLVSVPHQPANIPMKMCEFMLRFKRFNQNIAQPGQMTTKVAGVSASYQDLLVSLQRRVTGFTIGDQEIFLENNPDEVAGIIAEKMQSLETTWGLTLTYLHAAYAANQPSVSQLMLMKHHTHQPQDIFARLLQFLFTEHITCGALNRSRANFATMLSSFSEYINLTSQGEFVTVYSQSISEGAGISGPKVTASVVGERVVYDTTTPMGVEGYARFGVKSRTNGSDKPLSVEGMRLGSGALSYLVPVAGSIHDGDDRPDAPLLQPGLKRLFLTVGGCPDSFRGACHPGFFATDGRGSSGPGCGLSPRAVTDCAPSTTYFMDFDNNAVAKVTVRDLNRRLADPRVFEDAFCYEAWKRVFGPEMLGFVDEDATAALLKADPETRAASPLMAFETNPRHMWVASGVDAAADVKERQAPAAAGGAPTYVYYTRRGVLGNCSPCSDFHNEMVGAVGSLYHVVSGFTSDLSQLLEYMAVEVERVVPDRVLNFRTLDVAALAPGQMEAALKEVVAGGILCDPICQVIFLELYNVAADPTRPPAAAGAAGAPAQVSLETYVSSNTDHLHKMKQMIAGAIKDAQSCVETVYSEQRYNALMGAARPLVAMAAVTYQPRYANYLKFMYGFVMPIIGGRCVRPANSPVGANVLNAFAHPLLTLSDQQDLVYVSKGWPLPGGYRECRPYVAAAADIGLVRPLFATRLEMLHNNFSGCHLVKALGLMHYWTVYNDESLEHHLDRLYFSGLSYLVLRQMSFVGHSICSLPIKGARLLVGNRAAGFPVSTWQATEYKQFVDMGMVPVDTASMGVTCNNVFLSAIEGLNASFDLRRTPRACLVLDSYNSFLPEAMNNYQANSGMISLHGKFGAGPIEDVDVTGVYTRLPTSFVATSVPLAKARHDNMGIYGEDSSLGLLEETLKMGNFDNGVPVQINASIQQGLSSKDVLGQIMNGGVNRSNRNVFTPQLGAAFTDDYVVGEGASVLLRGGPGASSLNQELTPRISSQGGLTANGVFGQTDTDAPFMAAFTKQFSLAKMTHYSTF